MSAGVRGPSMLRLGPRMVGDLVGARDGAPLGRTVRRAQRALGPTTAGVLRRHGPRLPNVKVINIKLVVLVIGWV